MKTLFRISVCLALLLSAGCTADVPMVNLGIDDTYYIYRMQKLALRPALSGAEYRWSVDGDSVASTRDYIFLTADEGSYRLGFDIIDPRTPYHFEFTVNVLHEDVEYSPYIARVHEYCPAPGQFVNEMPPYEPGDTYADILRKAEESISGTNDVMITLGGFGGYVTFAFDHTVINTPGERDFRIWGNAFYELTDPSRKGGSAEPGVVSVSFDANCNGLPDDPFYELAGSAYHMPETRHGYRMTYRRPDPARDPEPDSSGFITDLYYIPWTDSEGVESFMPKNSFHGQEYFPQWVDAGQLSFSGTCLPPNAVDLSGTGSYYVLYAYDWGYVDNHPNDFPDLNSFDISWAVDSLGRKVMLPGIDFVRVHTGVNQYCGWLGETSTELCRAQDLHIAIPSSLPPEPILSINN
ncbi:MAG: cell surface protein [Muribaculaceae bacterium]|nr:cell surface protein [Muribaculaceae bacterium]